MQQTLCQKTCGQKSYADYRESPHLWTEIDRTDSATLHMQWLTADGLRLITMWKLTELS